jgi:hypothetical protein
MLHQWDQRADADPRKPGCCTRRNYRRGEIGRSDPDRALSTVGQLNHHVGGATSRSFPNYRKPFAKQKMPRIRNRDVSYGPIKNCRFLPCSVIRQSPMPSLIASSTPRTASPSTARPCANHRKKPPNATEVAPAQSHDDDRRRVATTPDLAIFEHPYVKRLESEVDDLKSKVMQRVEERISDGCIVALLHGWLGQDIMATCSNRKKNIDTA